jgi:hypothetical protein
MKFSTAWFSPGFLDSFRDNVDKSNIDNIRRLLPDINRALRNGWKAYNEYCIQHDGDDADLIAEYEEIQKLRDKAVVIMGQVVNQPTK